MRFDPANFPDLVQAILVEEMGRTPEDAKRLVKAYPQIVVNGIMGNFNYRACAMALEMKEEEDRIKPEEETR
jgi:hypothetical protein